MPAPVGRRVLGDLFGVSDPTITHWIREGMPRGKAGRYDLASCVQWYRARMDKALKERGADGDAKTELTRAQVERTRLDVAKLRGELVDASEAQRVLNEVAVIVSTQLDGLGPRVAGEVVGLTDVATIQGVIFREARAMRTAIAARISRFGEEVESQVDAEEAAA